MKEYQSLSHTRWDCKYHVVFIPKRRKQKVFGSLRTHLGEIFKELAQHKGRPGIVFLTGKWNAGRYLHFRRLSAKVERETGRPARPAPRCSLPTGKGFDGHGC